MTQAPRGPARPRRPDVAESAPAEPGYLLQAVESKAAFVVRLLGGEELRGRLEAYDRDALAVRDAAGMLRLVRRPRIACYWMERAAAAVAAARIGD